MGATACASPLGDRARKGDEGKNRPGHAISPGTPRQSPTGAATALQPSCPATRVPAWRQSNGPCPQLRLQVSGQLAGPVYRHRENWSRHLPCPPAGAAESRLALPRQPAEEVGGDKGPAGCPHRRGAGGSGH